MTTIEPSLHSFDKTIDNGNDNKPTITEVTELAEELARIYKNETYTKWYCKVINTLGVQRTKNLRDQCRDAKNPGKTFSKAANEEMNKKGDDPEKIQKYNDLKGRHEIG